jgi:hypothetical protein
MGGGEQPQHYQRAIDIEQTHGDRRAPHPPQATLHLVPRVDRSLKVRSVISSLAVPMPPL